MPLSESDAEALAAEITPHVRTLQVIHAALVGGVFAFLMFVLWQGLRPAEDEGAFPLTPAAFAAVSVVMSFVVPSIVRRSSLAALRGNSEITAESLVAAFQTGHIVGMAMLEGAAFLTCFTLTGGLGGAPRWFVAVPVALIMIMLIRFPRVASVADWVSTAREELTL
jgi:hypothetical protein